jgi:hypothetical protein
LTAAERDTVVAAAAFFSCFFAGKTRPKLQRQIEAEVNLKPQTVAWKRGRRMEKKTLLTAFLPFEAHRD